MPMRLSWRLKAQQRSSATINCRMPMKVNRPVIIVCSSSFWGSEIAKQKYSTPISSPVRKVRICTSLRRFCCRSSLPPN